MAYLFQKQEYTKDLARTKLLHPHKTGSWRSSFDPSFLNWEITETYKFLLKSNWNIDFLRMWHRTLFYKQEYWKYFARCRLFHPYERQKLVHGGIPLVFPVLIGKFEDLISSYSKSIEILIFLKCYTGLSVPKTRI